MRRLLTAASLAVSLVAFAEFTPTSGGVDYGLIDETDGEQTATVYLVNTGTEADQIIRVRTTCGCTVAAYDENLIEPGDTTWVEVTYNPRGRIGRFEKAVKITDSFKQTLTIPITGLIKASQETVESMYPVQAGPLALSTDKIMMDDLRMDESKHAFIEVYNNSDRTVSPLFESKSSAVEVVGKAKDIEPANFETYGFYVKTREADSTGPNEFTIDLYPTGDKEEPPFEIKIYVNIEGY